MFFRREVRPALLLACGLISISGQQPPPDFVAGPGGRGFRGPMGGPELKLLSKYDRNADGWLNAEERQVARANLEKEREEGGGRFGPRRFGRPDEEPPEPGKKISAGDVPSFPNAPFYDSRTLRTIFIQFENADWEKELSDFHNTDVEVPAKVTIDGKTYAEVGVHFRGMSSYMGVSEGRKRSLNLSFDMAHSGQNVGGYRTVNLLNAHEDPSFLRAILFYDIAREYIPAPKANFARVVINHEDWGVYQNVQQFNKDFVKENFGTAKGARWKVRGSPGGQGSLKYLGDDPEAYKGIYTIKSKDDPKSWAALIRLCKVLNETPPEKLQTALSPILDVDAALKFLALDNALINNDGYWIRTSDYSIYLDEKGKFHIIPQDANETFTRPGMMGGMPPFNPAMMLVRALIESGDKNKDEKLAGEEFADLSREWFEKLDSESQGKVNADEFTREMAQLLPDPMGPGGPNRPGPRDGTRQFPRGGRFAGPRVGVASALFAVADRNKDGSLTRAELSETFANWHSEWDTDKDNALAREELQRGLDAVLPPPQFGPRIERFVGRGGNPGEPPGAPERGPGGRFQEPSGPVNRPDGPRRFGRGPGANMPRVEGVKLSPLAAARDEDKPLISKLLAVRELKQKYLAYVRDIAERNLDWEKLGAKAQSYHDLIEGAVKEDTRKLDSTEAFEKSLTEDISGGGGPRITISLKSFAEQRREYLLNFKEDAGANP